MPVPLSDSYWVLEVGDTSFNLRIEHREAERVQQWLTSGAGDWFAFYNISGSRCFYARSQFRGMYESTVEQREHGREHQKVIDAEVPKQFD